jgi:transcriptional regulator with XRE-family HTH domain
MPTFLEVSRRNVGMTQGQLAAHSGVSRATISAIERGEREPSRQTLDKLDQALVAAAGGAALTWAADALPHQSTLKNLTWLPRQLERSPRRGVAGLASVTDLPLDPPAVAAAPEWMRAGADQQVTVY